MTQSQKTVRDTEKAIRFIKETFPHKLSDALNLERISAPLFVTADSGLNDNLNGVERVVSFDIKNLGGVTAEVVQSLAKWKRWALGQYGFLPGEGLYTDMNAIRRDDDVDFTHSIYVDQWDWEKVITRGDRNEAYLKDTVVKIVGAVKAMNDALDEIGEKHTEISPDVHFVTTQQLEDMYPGKTPREREQIVTKQYKTVFIMQIGDLLKSGSKHDGRAPDYDDWSLNGDIFIYHEALDYGLEISSMGIRVDKAALLSQLTKAKCEDRKNLPFHMALINETLPLTMGGGIGQSRLCMLLLQKHHIGEVQASLWPDEMREECGQNGIILL